MVPCMHWYSTEVSSKLRTEVSPREYPVRPRDSCIWVSGVKNISILESFFITNVQMLK